MYGSVDELPATHEPAGPAGGEHLAGAEVPKSYPVKEIIYASLIVIQFFTLSPKALKQISQ